MAADLIDPAIHRLDLLAHLNACAPCAHLLGYARAEGDLPALTAWRTQLAAHVAADGERQDFDRDVFARLATYRREGGRP